MPYLWTERIDKTNIDLNKESLDIAFFMSEIYCIVKWRRDYRLCQKERKTKTNCHKKRIDCASVSNDDSRYISQRISTNSIRN